MSGKMRTRAATLSIVIALGILLAACSPSSPVVGKWEAIDSASGESFIFSFKSDGGLEISALGVTYDGTYELVDADSLTMTSSLLGPDAYAFDFVRSGDALTLTLDGVPLELNKIP